MNEELPKLTVRNSSTISQSWRQSISSEDSKLSAVRVS